MMEKGQKLKNGCKKFHGHYSAANFSTPRLSFRREFESHARKLIAAEWIVCDSESCGDEAGHGRNVAADRRITKRHETKANA